ncbi:MAG TPA: hypothetical protein VFA51_06375, partial [Candidatus Udaeobacter sp.]|nr:hypothetical protein [Candidatus Udaeobacter sp.]
MVWQLRAGHPFVLLANRTLRHFFQLDDGLEEPERCCTHIQTQHFRLQNGAAKGNLSYPDLERMFLKVNAPNKSGKREHMNKKIKIVVIGGTGLIGTKVVNNLR